MNGGHIASNGEPTTTPVYSATNGGWNSGTGVFTPTSGDPSLTVAVDDFANVFVDGATAPVFIGRVTAVSSTTITVSTTAKGGTAPTTAGTGISINVGGAWKGPNGAAGFPYNFAIGVMVNSAGDYCRVNFKNDATYSITAAMTHAQAGPVTFQGYTSTFGDFGKATIDGGTTGASYVLLAFLVGAANRSFMYDMIFQNNGATGTSDGLTNFAIDTRSFGARMTVNSVRGSGFGGAGNIAECEAYACNQSNTANKGGFDVANGSVIRRCFSYRNVGSNSNGFYAPNASPTLINCVSAENGGHGLLTNNNSHCRLFNSDFFGNTGDGWRHLTSDIGALIENCNFVGNGGWGINALTTTVGYLWNNGFGDNTSGAKQNTSRMIEENTVTYGAGVRPWVDAPNGNFRINLTASKGTGRGNFLQTSVGYSGTVAYPDIGAAQHQDTGGLVGQLKQFNRGTPY